MRDPQYQLKGPPLQPEVGLLGLMDVAVVYRAEQWPWGKHYQLSQRWAAHLAEIACQADRLVEAGAAAGKVAASALLLWGW